LKSGLWMINETRWAVTVNGMRFDPTNTQSLVGYVTQANDLKWTIDGDPEGRCYALPEHAVQDLIGSRSKGDNGAKSDTIRHMKAL
jgi:hypothetical protein